VEICTSREDEPAVTRKKAVSIIARSRNAALQGFAWVAREP
jgi:hypothetical protein